MIPKLACTQSETCMVCLSAFHTLKLHFIVINSFSSVLRHVSCHQVRRETIFSLYATHSRFKVSACNMTFLLKITLFNYMIYKSYLKNTGPDAFRLKLAQQLTANVITTLCKVSCVHWVILESLGANVIRELRKVRIFCLHRAKIRNFVCCFYAPVAC